MKKTALLSKNSEKLSKMLYNKTVMLLKEDI